MCSPQIVVAEGEKEKKKKLMGDDKGSPVTRATPTSSQLWGLHTLH